MSNLDFLVKSEQEMKGTLKANNKILLEEDNI